MVCLPSLFYSCNLIYANCPSLPAHGALSQLYAVRNIPHLPCGRRLRASMRSAQAVCMILTIFLAVISQSTLSAAQGVVTQTGKETIESYDSATEVLTISA